MAKEYSDSLTRLRKIVKRDYSRLTSTKAVGEIKDLLYLFVDNCPSNAGPEKAMKFVDFDIKNGCEYSRLKKKIINELALKKGVSYKYCENGNKMESLIDEIETIYSTRRKAVIFFSKGSNGEMDSLFIRIRNSFAHGNYFKVRDYYYLWNETGSGTKKLGSFMVLKYKDLMAIYDALSGVMK